MAVSGRRPQTESVGLLNERHIGQRIRARREELGLNQTELGKRMGATQSQITKWETGERNPSRKQWDGLADALEIDLDTLVGWLAEDSRTTKEQVRQLEHDIDELQKMLTRAIEAMHTAAADVRAAVLKDGSNRTTH